MHAGVVTRFVSGADGADPQAATTSARQQRIEKSGLAASTAQRRIVAVRAAVMFTLLMTARVASADPTRGKLSPPSSASIVRVAPTCDGARKHCVEIALHVAAVEGALVTTPEWIARQLTAANQHFAAIDLGFQLRSVDVLPAAAAHLRTRADRSALGNHLGGPVIHVFITGQLESVDDDQPVHGVTWRKGARKYVIVAATAWERTLTHELGHFFGLPHSTYAISLMNKTRRDVPPPAERTFAAEELATMRAVLARLLRSKVIANVAPAGPRW
jgi:hypothetical protein